jgi:hypothetical protein
MFAAAKSAGGRFSGYGEAKVPRRYPGGGCNFIPAMRQPPTASLKLGIGMAGKKLFLLAPLFGNFFLMPL